MFSNDCFGGVLQIIVGLFKLGKVYTTCSATSVMYGFVNGLAIVIFMSQLEQFKININGKSTDSLAELHVSDDGRFGCLHDFNCDASSENH